MIEMKLLHICINCYWFDGKWCEIHHKTIERGCMNYLNDYIHYKMVQRWIREDPEKARKNWNLLDDIDRRKFEERWGSGD